MSNLTEHSTPTVSKLKHTKRVLLSHPWDSRVPAEATGCPASEAESTSGGCYEGSLVPMAMPSFAPALVLEQRTELVFLKWCLCLWSSLFSPWITLCFHWLDDPLLQQNCFQWRGQKFGYTIFLHMCSGHILPNISIVSCVLLKKWLKQNWLYSVLNCSLASPLFETLADTADSLLFYQQ